MKRVFLFLILITASIVAAQNPAQPIPTGANGTFRVVGYVLTTSPVNICNLVASASDVVPPCGRIVYVCSGDINASTGTSATITLTDGAGNPFWATVPALSSTNASSYNIPFGAYPFCRPFPSGLLVSASSGSVITLSVSGYY